MANVSPFSGYHYNPKLIADLSDVITPPYDNIPAGEEETYWNRSPYNFAHVDLPKSDGDDYSAASHTLSEWIQKGVLTHDKAPCYYWYRQTFTTDGHRHTRDALIASVSLADFSEGIIRPHENTHGKAKKDRLQSLRSTRFNLSHIFGMVKDPDGFLNSLMERWEFNEPLLQGTTKDGAAHAIWKLEADLVPELAAFFKEHPIYIVDGHHRYESALAYARETGALGNDTSPASRTLFSISNAFDPGLIVMPTHRGLKSLGDALSKRSSISSLFHLTPFNVEQLPAFTHKTTATTQFVVGFENALFLCSPKADTVRDSKADKNQSALWKLPMQWSDRVLLSEYFGVPESDFGSRIQYEKDPLLLWENRAKYDFLIFHARPKVTDVTDVADEKSFMPPKSTYFFPKLASGLVLRALE
jgi:uncharacterized protein (DUF1015 family)